MVLASFALRSSLRKILDGAAPAARNARLTSAPISDIKHVVVLMQENRSFDHYFGAMPGVRGFADPSVPSSRFYQTDAQNPDNYLLPFHADTLSTSAQNLPSNSHSWGPQHDSWDNGKMDGFVTAHLAADGVAGQYTMAYFQRDDIPFHWALADAFTILDGYHCSVLGPTWPNRLYLMTGQLDPAGANGGGQYGNYVPAEGYSWQTYPELLTNAGVSWKVYQEIDNYGMNVLEYFDQYQNATVSSTLYQGGMKISQPGQFEYDAMHDNLPTVSWIVPTSFQSEHPDYMPAAGADFVASKINAIAANPDVFAKTLFILIYDENDGFFDHVPPPTAPAGTAGEYLSVSPLPSDAGGIRGPVGMGFRVPMLVISPFSRGGYVASDVFDHTSQLRFLEERFGVRAPNISPWRRKTAGDLTPTLHMGHKDVSSPSLPSTSNDLPANVMAEGCSQLDILEGSGNQPPSPVPASQVMPGQETGTVRRV